MTTAKQATPEPPEPTSGHLTVRPEGSGPSEVRFMFENQEKRTWGAGTASVLAHLAFIGLIVLLSQLLPEKVYETILPDRLSEDIVWLASPGPGGGGGGGNKAPDPPKRAELPGREKISVPEKPPDPEPVPEPPKEEPPPIEVTIPAQTMAAATTIAPGALNPSESTDSRGSGIGTGAGPGRGSGIGPGFGGGIGGGAYQPGNGVIVPTVIRDVKPQYTAEAMRAKVQGVVVVECVVLTDGTVGNVEVVRSLDPTFGLDQEAVKAAKQWRFKPGMRMGEPVPVLVTIELTFTLR
jgi:TonB family protein